MKRESSLGQKTSAATQFITAALCVIALACLLLPASFQAAFAQTPPTSAPAALPPGWEEIDRRLVFLTIELSGVESSIVAIDKAIRVTGYQQSNQNEKADNAAHSNELMDRNGGGPVSWKDFYGKTAEKFFYHPTDDSTLNIDPLPIDSRPPQFDYIYRANEENQAKAHDEAAQLGGKIDELKARRAELETEQSGLWCKIAFRAVDSRELPTHPIYRFDPRSQGSSALDQQQVAAVRAGADFMRSVSGAIEMAEPQIDTDQHACLDQLQQGVSAARAGLNSKLVALPALAVPISNPHSRVGQLDKAAQRLADSAQNLADATRLAAEADQRDDMATKSQFRGQVQQSVMDFAATVLTADDALTAMAAEWKVMPDTSKAVLVTGAGITAPSTGGLQAGNAAENITARLDQAKLNYDNAVDAARKSFVAAIDQRLEAATDAGDLASVQAIQPIKESATADAAAVPDDVKDPAIALAKNRYTQRIQSADVVLASAYRQAIRDYTRAHDIDLAQNTQAEFQATGISNVTAAAAANGGASATFGRFYSLTGGLPSYMQATEACRLDKNGIITQAFIHTDEGDFLRKDFTFDIEFTTKKEGEAVMVGLYDGGDPDGDEDSGAFMVADPPGNGGRGGAVSVNNKRWDGQEAGKVKVPGTYVIRVAKTGNAVMFEFGSETDGKFTADMSSAVPDLPGFAPTLTDRNTYLFFGHRHTRGKDDGNISFDKVRLTLGTPAAEESGTPTGAGSSGLIAKFPPPAPPAPTPSAAAPLQTSVAPSPAAPTPTLAVTPPPVMSPPSPVAVAPAPTATSGQLKPGLLASVYSDRFGALLSAHTDPSIDFIWNKGNSPGGAERGTLFSIRWTGVLMVDGDGRTIGFRGGLGATVTIDGQQTVESQSGKEVFSTQSYKAGPHSISIDYWNKTVRGTTRAQLSWNISGKGAQPIPASALFHNVSGVAATP